MYLYGENEGGGVANYRPWRVNDRIRMRKPSGECIGDMSKMAPSSKSHNLTTWPPHPHLNNAHHVASILHGHPCKHEPPSLLNDHGKHVTCITDRPMLKLHFTDLKRACLVISNTADKSVIVPTRVYMLIRARSRDCLLPRGERSMVQESWARGQIYKLVSGEMHWAQHVRVVNKFVYTV